MKHTQTFAKKKGAGKLAIGLAVVGMATLVGSVGTVGAQAMHGGKTSAELACKNEAAWRHQGFKNQGQCVSALQAGKKTNGGGSGYGGSNPHVSNNLNLQVNGSNNVINIVINYFFGS